MSYSLNNKEDINNYSDLLKDKLIKRSEFQNVNHYLNQNGEIVQNNTEHIELNYF
ncbi:hypothetical protein ACW95P_00660 [Candidatus Mycoplasma pogonae]